MLKNGNVMFLLIYFIIAYLLGNVMVGYMLVKIFFRHDVREQGSGNVGARNVGRLYGKTFFVLTFLGDAFKGAAVILLGVYWHLSSEAQLIGLSLALLGHLKPIILRFHGGKGVSTFLGGMITYDPSLVIIIPICFFMTYPFTKSFTKSGLGAFAMVPIYLFIQSETIGSIGLVAFMILVIVLAHSTKQRGKT